LAYNFRRTITTDHTQVSGIENLIDFPYAVTLSGSYMKSTDSGGDIESPYGYDIIFTDITGNPLNHEVENYSPAEQKCTAWVSLPILSPTEDIIFYVYYGNSDITSTTENPYEVWGSNAKAVLHLVESADGTASGTEHVWMDSTSNANHMHDYVSASGKEGVISRGQEFDGVDDYMYANSTSSLEISDAITMSVWVKPDSYCGNNDWFNLIIKDKGVAFDEDYTLYLWGETATSMTLSATFFGFSAGDQDFFGTGEILIPLNVWTHCAMTFDGANFKFYVNGIPDYSTTQSGTIATSTSVFHLADPDISENPYFDGHMDDVRVYNTALTKEWIQTEYNNQFGHLPQENDTYTVGNYEVLVCEDTFIGISSGSYWMGVPLESVGKIIGVPWCYYSEPETETWLGTWAKRRKFTVKQTNVDSDLTHYPTLVLLGTSVGIDTDDLSNVFDEVGANSKKIAFTKADGITQLYAEIEYWNNTSETAAVWVSKSDWTIASGTDTEAYIYFDNTQSDNTTYVNDPGSRTEVWDNNFKAVWHLGLSGSDGTSGEFIDSTGNNHDITGVGYPSQAAGKISYGQDFNGSSDYLIEDPCPAGLQLDATDFTIQLWAYPRDVSNEYVYTATTWNTPDAGYGFGQLDDDLQLFVGNEKALENTGSVTVNDWNHIATVFRDTDQDVLFYMDGSWIYTDTSMADELGTTTNPFVVGVDPRDLSGYEFDGIMEELRISDSDRGAAWIKADYYSQDDNILTWSDTEFYQSITLLYDDFQRADSDTVGGGWTVVEGGITGWGASNATISGGRLHFETGDHVNEPMVSQTFTKQTTGTIEWSFILNFSRTGTEGSYEFRMQLGDSASLGASHTTGVAVSLIWTDPGNGITDHEGFGTSDGATYTQIGVVTGPDGYNDGGDATVTVSVDLDANTYDITITGDGLFSGTGTATGVAFDNNVDIDTVRFYTNSLNIANFNHHEIDDVLIKTV